MFGTHIVAKNGDGKRKTVDTAVVLCMRRVRKLTGTEVVPGTDQNVFISIFATCIL